MGEVGRLFLFLAVVILITIFMIIVNVQDHADTIQQKAADFQQITKGDVLIHHTDHLPSAANAQWEQKQTAYRYWYALKNQYTTLCKNCQIYHRDGQCSPT